MTRPSLFATQNNAFLCSDYLLSSLKYMKVDLPLRIEIPRTPGEFKTGLMFRESLDTDSGMLFVFNGVAILI